MKRALALVIGVNDYLDDVDKLNNAVNDANDIADKLFGLGFIVIKKVDCDKHTFEDALKEFEDKLSEYDVGLFYYSGHSFQVNGENFLTATNSDLKSSTWAKSSSISLNLIIELMEDTAIETKIIILDCCRNNPLRGTYRGSSGNLAPVHAPQGTFIAFSTSPGEKALDYGMGHNSIYTGCLLKHLEDPDIPIEVLFKRVRISVVTFTNKFQTPWEHTSLIGSFFFNPLHLIHASKLPYEAYSIAYEQFKATGSDADNLIVKLLSTSFDDQKSASNKLKSKSMDGMDISKIFLLGRALLSAAHFGSFVAQKAIRELPSWIDKYQDSGVNHLMNGILFEIYFNEQGKLRTKYFKVKMINELFGFEKIDSFIPSLNFLKEQLLPLADNLYYLPFEPKITIEADFHEIDTMFFETPIKVFRLNSLRHETVNLLHVTPTVNFLENYSEVSFKHFEEFVSENLVIPFAKLNIVYTHNQERKNIYIPYSFKISKISSAPI